MSTTTTTANNGPHSRIPLAHAVGVPLTQAADEAQAWWDEYRMLDDLDLGDDLDDVLISSRRQGLETVEDLRREARNVIADVTGTAHISNFTTAAAANGLHRARNTIAALIFAAQVRHASDAQGAYDLLTALPAVAPRHGSKRRPLHDDEVLLTRSACIHSLRRGGRFLSSANQYALAESAAYPMETTSIRPADFDSVIEPGRVLLPGVHTWSTRRQARLTPFAARFFAESVALHLASGGGAKAALCFTGAGKASASAASSANLKNLTNRVGITRPELEGSAITRWRIHKELKDSGDFAALRLMGKVKTKKDKKGEEKEYYDVTKVYDFLNLPPESAPKPETDEYDGEDFQNLNI